MWFLPSQVSAHGFNQLRIMHVILQYAFSERNSCINRPAQFKPVLFKGQLYFSKEHWFLLLGSGIRNQDLCSRCPPCYYGIFASLPIQWTELGKTCTHKHTYVHIHAYKLICTQFTNYEKIILKPAIPVHLYRVLPCLPLVHVCISLPY